MEREIISFGGYYDKFMEQIPSDVKKKIHYVFDVLSTQERISKTE